MKYLKQIHHLGKGCDQVVVINGVNDEQSCHQPLINLVNLISRNYVMTNKNVL